MSQWRSRLTPGPKGQGGLTFRLPRFDSAQLHFPDRHRHNTSHKHAGSPAGYYFKRSPPR